MRATEEVRGERNVLSQLVHDDDEAGSTDEDEREGQYDGLAGDGKEYATGSSTYGELMEMMHGATAEGGGEVEDEEEDEYGAAQ